MEINSSHVAAFDEKTKGREASGAQNKLREELIVWLGNAGSEEVQKATGALKNGRSLAEIEGAWKTALEDLEKWSPSISGLSLFEVVQAGGRGNNFDFQFLYGEGSRQVKIEVELKRGKSIYDQPQFWQVYTNYQGILDENVPTYPEFFYANHLESLLAALGITYPTLEIYVASVYRTDHSTEPFLSLYEVATASEEGLRLLRETHYQSVHEYVRFLSGFSNWALNLSTLQSKLFLQLSKHFLSWDPYGRTFGWEKFDKESLTLTGEINPLGKRSGQLHTLSLKTKTGQELQLLLRWKNRPCVQGPAWQIKLTSM